MYGLISVTPLWRNGPEDKPVLCNACGSRYKKRGSLGLEDYLPKNFQPEFFDKYKDQKGRKKKSSFSIYIYITDAEIDTYLCVRLWWFLLLAEKSERLWSTKIPTKKRSEVVYKEITPLERFHIRLLKMSKNHRNPNETSSEEVLLLNNANNFIPSTEIGIGCVILK